MDLNALGRLITMLGIGLLILGGLLIAFSRMPGLKHLGNLPGDVRIEGENFSCFVPIVSMIIISVLLSLALNIIIRLLGR